MRDYDRRLRRHHSDRRIEDVVGHPKKPNLTWLSGMVDFLIGLDQPKPKPSMDAVHSFGDYCMKTRLSSFIWTAFFFYLIYAYFTS